MNDIDDIITQSIELANQFVDALPVHKKDKNELRQSSLTLVSAFLTSDDQMSLPMKTSLFLQCLSDLKDEHSDLRYFFTNPDDATLMFEKIDHSQEVSHLVKNVKTEKKNVNLEEIVKKFKACVACSLRGESFHVYLCGNGLSGTSDKFNTELFQEAVKTFINDQPNIENLSVHDKYIVLLKDIIHQTKLCGINIFKGLDQEIVIEHAPSFSSSKDLPKPLAVRRP